MSRLALTVRQPWAWAICAGLKDVENRSWPPRHTGRLLIHAGKQLDASGYAICRELLNGRLPLVDELTFGAVIGEVTVTGHTRDSASAWAAPGQLHWQLADAVLWREPLPCRGQLGLFEIAA